MAAHEAPGEAGAKWTHLATHDLAEEIYATPAIVDGRIYLRTSEALYCFGSSESIPVSVLVTVTVTPAMTAPVASVTFPRMLPCVDCAATGCTVTQTAKINVTARTDAAPKPVRFPSIKDPFFNR